MNKVVVLLFCFLAMMIFLVSLLVLFISLCE